MTTGTIGWNAGDHIESFREAAAYMQVSLQGKMNEKIFMSILTDIANSKWMEQRAKEGKQVILAGKG